VLSITMARPGDVGTAQAEELGMLAGVAIAVAARTTDLYNLVRRRQQMSLPASMQWDLLPPLCLRVPSLTSVGVVEPAYDVGGDCFDHVVNGSKFDLALVDSMGHGLSASVVSALALGCYRHDRREGQPLGVMHERLDRIVGAQFGGEPYVSGLLARLDLRSGELQWTNAGHPTPLLVRGGKARSLRCAPSLPWGLGGPLAQQATDQLLPGDDLVFYTDGVIEGRSAEGPEFGLERFVGLVEEAAADRSPSDGVVRDLIHQVLAFQGGMLRDDATIVWLTWRPGE
jgi:serine phosphatase RsbU (regulator of sigma subunit)